MGAVRRRRGIRWERSFFIVEMFVALPAFAYAQTYGQGSYGGGAYAGVLPMVTSVAASSISQTGAMLNGSVTSIGSTSPSLRGFEHGATSVYGATTTDSGGPFSAGSFSASITGLTCGTAYHFRAYATNDNGTGYGSDTNFTTSACASSGGSSGGGGSHRSGSSTRVVVPASTTTATIPAQTNPAAAEPVSSTPVLSLSRFLYFGMEGNDVRQLQQFLKGSGYYTYPTITGYFGQITKDSVIAFQKANGIEPLGGVGPLTRAKLLALAGANTPQLPTSVASSSPFTRDLELGSIGEDVRALQRFLNGHGFQVAASSGGSPGSETTTFGEKTQATLVKFQAANGITPAVGYFGPKTRALVQSIL